MPIRSNRLPFYAGAAAAALVAFASPVAAIAQQRTFTFDIPAQDLDSALKAVASASGEQIIYEGSAVRGQRSGPLRGTYSTDDAVRALLAKTGLGVTRSARGVLVVAPIVAGNSPSAGAEAEIPEIVVTGSHIRGAAAAGAQIETYSREDLDRSGYATVQEFIKTLPQNFQGGGGTEDRTQGTLTSSNILRGSSANLRGLGSDATLVLINGRRPPASGYQGNFVDISTLSQSAIERIEVLPDGASALYGSDAIGGVINFILRKDFDGAETRLRYGRAPDQNVDEYRAAQLIGTTWNDGYALISYEYYAKDSLKLGNTNFASTLNLTDRGGEDYRYTLGNPGNIFDPFTFQPAFAIPENQDGTSLTVNQLLPGQVNKSDDGANNSLLPRQRRHSVYITAEQSVSPAVTITGDIIFSQRNFKTVNSRPFIFAFVPDTNPFYVDPFNIGMAIVGYQFGTEMDNIVTRGRVRSGAISGGMRFDISKWRLKTDVSYGREKSLYISPFLSFDAVDTALADANPATALNVFGHGNTNNPATLAKLLTAEARRSETSILNLGSVLDGPIATVRGRNISLALGLDYRKEKFASSIVLPGVLEGTEGGGRSIYAAFAEVYAPLIGSTDAIPLIRSLDISVAGRVDRYSDVGTTANPKLGVRLAPNSWLTLNGTFGTSFRAPNLIEQSTTDNGLGLEQIPDPLAPAGRSTVLLLSGNDPEVKPEKASTWSFGATLEPESIRGLRITGNYFKTEYTNKIDVATVIIESVLVNESLFDGVVFRNPDSKVLEAYCTSPRFQGDPSQCNTNIVKAIIDLRTKNTARVFVDGFDISANYSFNAGDISLTGGANATYMFSFKKQNTGTSRLIDHVDTFSNPADLRGRGYISAAKGGLSGTISANYTDSYRHNQSALQSKIKSNTTVDLALSATFNNELNLRPNGNLGATLSVTNLFNKLPPFVDTYYAYDPSNANASGRFVSLELKLNW